MKRAALLASVLPASALAAGEAVPAVSVAPMLGALLAVVAAIFAAAFLFKKSGLQGGGANAALLKPVASLSLGTREKLVVVQVADRWLVLGVTAQSIQALADLDAQALPAAPAAAAPFAGLLAKALKRHD
jgi:flagellar protein FliO/FliZ